MVSSLRTACLQCSIQQALRRSSLRHHSRTPFRWITTLDSREPIITVERATFYRHYASNSDQAATPLFKDINFSFGGAGNKSRQWAVISPTSASRTAFLQTLAGQHIVVPPAARKYPALSEAGISSHQAIKYVGFDADRGDRIGGTSLRGAYLSARYESRRESTDFFLRDYLAGQTELNGLEKEIDVTTLEEVIDMLNLRTLANMPVSNLSNGQTRRARIAKALMDKPFVLLLDGPFMGLDPRAVKSVSSVLETLVKRGQPRLVISLRPQDAVPDWIDSLIIMSENNQILAQGEKRAVQAQVDAGKASQTNSAVSSGAPAKHQAKATGELGEALIEMSGVQVAYGDKVVLGDWAQEIDDREQPGLWWTLRRGQRCGIFGSNGSGKTTMLSLITSDHPQTYGLPVKIFGRSRLPEPGVPGISVFDLQKRIGHSSPEAHAFFPRRLSIRRTLQSAWADAPLAPPVMDDVSKARVDNIITAFEEELLPASARQSDWADQTRFGELSFSSQRLLLFLRAIVAQPDLIILDEAFSGMDEAVRDKTFAFLTDGLVQTDGTAEDGFRGLTDDQALLVVSHAKEDVPDCIREWIRLPDPGSGHQPYIGMLTSSLNQDPSGWNQIWDV